MAKINLLFQGFEKNDASLIKKYPFLNHRISIYYGYSKQGNYRLALRSSISPFKSNSTKIIYFSFVKVSESEYWSYFDLIDETFLNIFFKFIESIIESIKENISEQDALSTVNNIFEMWKKMFEKTYQELSLEKAQGLYGELISLINLPNISANNITIDELILGWGGGDNLTKDISIDQTWFEIKTRKSNTDKIKITRIEQLESIINGYLVVVTVEVMSEAYNVKPSSIKELVEYILEKINSPRSKYRFLEKLNLYGYDFFQEIGGKQFCLIDFKLFEVNDQFPRLLKGDINKPEIIDVSYSLSVNSLERFKVEKWN